MYLNGRYINAGTNEIHRYGRKAREYAAIALNPNENGYYAIPVDGGKYWTLGTSNGKYGEFAKVNGTIFSVNSIGMMYAKAGTEKGELFVKAVQALIDEMNKINDERFEKLKEEEEDEEE